LMLRYASVMTQKQAAELLRIPASTLAELLHRTIKNLRKGRKIRGLKRIGIDEISYRKGHKYITLVYDLDRSCVVWIGEGKGRATIDRFFEDNLSQYQRDKIKIATCDMSQAYLGAIKHHCKNAELVLDRFHVMKALNDHVDKVRKEEWRKLTDKDERKALKGMRWLLYKHPSNRSKKDTRTINELRRANRRIHRAWVLKDEFNQLWEYSSRTWAKKFLRKWCTTAMRSQLEPIKKFVATVRCHEKEMLNFVGTRVTNATGEGINRVIRMVKNQASGFRNVNNFMDMIYLTVGDVDLPAQIPQRFRTI
jgi:transposase